MAKRNTKNGTKKAEALTKEAQQPEEQNVAAPEPVDASADMPDNSERGMTADVAPTDESPFAPEQAASEPTPADTQPEAAAVSEVPEGVTPALITGLENYIEAMALNRMITPDEGVRAQKQLRNTIIHALSVEDDATAVKNIRYIMDVFHKESKGVFSIRAVFRFYDQVNWDAATDRREIEDLIMLFMSTANPETRQQEVKVMDLNNLANVLEPRRSEVLLKRIRKAYGQG